jgi:hypothetical protein
MAYKTAWRSAGRIFRRCSNRTEEKIELKTGRDCKLFATMGTMGSRQR